MIHSGELRSGKGSHDENFPVASRLIKRQHRPAILAFYIGINNEIQGILDCGVKAISYLIKLFKRQRRWTGISSMYAQHLLLSPPPTL